MGWKFQNCWHSLKGTLKSGLFDELPPEIAEKTGKKNYDFEMILWDGEMVTHASITDNGTRMVMKSMFPNCDPIDELFLLKYVSYNIIHL